jgi:hypothetical protein
MAKLKMRAAWAGLLALSLTGAAAAEPPRAPRKVHADYLITWLGLPVYAARFTGAWNGERYAMRFEAEALGLARLANTTTIDWETRGRFEAAAPRPEHFEQTNTFRRQIRRITLAYRGNGAPAVSVVPPESPGKRPPVPEALKAGTLDPLSAAFAAVAMPADTRRCGYATKVFEGLRRTDVRLDHAGSERTPVHRVRGFERQALVCLMHAKRVAGYEEKHFRQHPEPLPPAMLWVARHAEAGLWLPVQLRFDSSFGPLYARLVRLEIANAAGQ